MSEALQIIKPEVRRLRAYSLRPDRARIKLNQNENAWDTPAEVKEEVLRRVAISAWSRYPDFISEGLHRRLAQHCGWTPEGIIAGNGSNELIQALMMATLSEGKRVLISEPTFALYRQLATILGAEVLSVPLTNELQYDVAALKAAIQSAAPAVTVVCSPNNPTGCLLNRRDLASLLEVAKGLVVVDEAYFEFANETAVPLLEQYPNLIVLRTFSKAMALAGLRLGYLLAAPELVREISKAVLPYNLNFISQTAAEVALEMYQSKLKSLVSLICAERERLFMQLEQIEGLKAIPSRANFILIRSAIAPQRIYQQLLRRNILVRDVSSYPMLQDCFRISVGTPEENDELVSALKEIFAGKEQGIRAQS